MINLGRAAIAIALGLVCGIALAAGGMTNPNVTGQAAGNNGTGGPDRYEVTITIYKGDPAIRDLHFYWSGTVQPGPTAANWNGPNGWNTNTGSGPTPGGNGTEQSHYVSFTTGAPGVATGGDPVTLTFTYQPYGNTQHNPATVSYFVTTDGQPGLPGGFGDPDIEHMGIVNQAGDWNFPTG